jgi:hypothetical protein
MNITRKNQGKNLIKVFIEIKGKIFLNKGTKSYASGTNMNMKRNKKIKHQGTKNLWK